MIDLSGKTALVTGGRKGIGREVALKLAEAGCDVAVCGIRQEDTLDTVQAIRNMGRKSEGFGADVSNSEQVSQLFKGFFEKFENLDILINNAGITRDGLLMRMKESDWDTVLDINLKGAFLCTKEALRPMIKAKSGKIINISSVVGLTGNAGQANYSASKAGLIGFTKTTAREVASRGICVNAVAPGYIITAMTDKLSEGEKEKLTAQIPMQKLGLPEDVANSILFLSSSLSDYITGQVLTVDGGLVMA